MTSMVSRFFLAVASILAVASGAMAAGPPSPSRPPEPSRPRPSNYEMAVRAVQAGDYARALSVLQRVVKSESRDADAWNLADRGSSETYGFADEGFEAGLFACLVCIG